VAISAEWKNFIAEYGVDHVYWYIPKGGTADTDDFREKFRVFDLFENEGWTPITQRRIAASLREEGLSKGGNALPRQIKRVYENLGLCWIDDNQPIRITGAGKAYLEEQPGRSKVLDRQIWRYQLPTPVNSSAATAGIELHPHVFFVGVLLNCEGYVTSDEFVLFISRARMEEDLGKVIGRIRAWRKLSYAIQNEIKWGLRNTHYDTINRDHSYSLAFHHCDLLLHRGQGGLYVEAADLDRLKQRLAQHKGVSEIIEFRSKPDYIASLADPERTGTQIDALEYYIDVSDVANAVKVYKKLPKSVRGDKTPEEFEAEQFLEEQLEEYLQDHLDKVEAGLTLIARQHSTKVGPIDLFARAKNGDLVVLELKKGRAADKVFGQICRYMGCVKAEQPKKAPKKVRGYIVGREIDEKLHYATKVVEAGLIGLQVFELADEKGKDDWIQVTAAC
jgi:Holliday junction resolvase-like predicted endonuclease